MDFRGAKTYSFMALYLMGLERHILEKDYIEDYSYSGGLTTLDSIEDAHIVRCASRIRQKVYRNYSQYRAVTDFEETASEYFNEELIYLKEKGLDLGQAFRSTYSIISVINRLTEIIATRISKVLKQLKFPYPDVVEHLFYMFNVTDKSLDKYIKAMQANRAKYPYMMYITRNSRLGTYLPHLFQNDKTFIIGCFNLAEESYELDTLDIPFFEWSCLGVEDVAKLPIDTSTHFYVDCDNVSYFTFLALLESLKSTAKATDMHVFNLYIDETTSGLWRMTSHLEHPLFYFNIIEVERVKYTKSVVDIVMVAHIAQNSVKNEDIPAVIVSSDSDYIGLIQAGVQLDGVFYENINVNHEYVTQLKRQKVKNFNIGSLASDKFKQEHENVIIRQMVLEYLPSIPMVEWTTENITNHLSQREAEIMEYEVELIEHNVKYQVDSILESLEIVMVNGKPTITLKECKTFGETSNETVVHS